MTTHEIYIEHVKEATNESGNSIMPEGASQSELNRPDDAPVRITTSQWITVLILCFVNLINYMDRYTIAGE